MFLTTNKIKQAIKELLDARSLVDAEKINQKVKQLNEELEELKLKKRLEEEEIKHLVKMKEEKMFIETQRKEVSLEKKFNEREMEMQRKYHEKFLGAFEEQRKENKELYSAIMSRLPNVNVDIKRK